MTLALTATLVLLAAGFLILLDRKDQRQAKERAELYQRIQAPEVAVIDHQLQTSPPSPPSVGFEDDAGWWESKEELAERLNGH